MEPTLELAAGPTAAKSRRATRRSGPGPWEAQALAELDARLAQNPGDINAHARRGDLLEAQGDIRGAFNAYTAALAAAREENEAPPEPPGWLLRRQGQLMDKLMAK